MYKYGFDTGKM